MLGEILATLDSHKGEELTTEIDGPNLSPSAVPRGTKTTDSRNTPRVRVMGISPNGLRPQPQRLDRISPAAVPQRPE